MNLQYSELEQNTEKKRVVKNQTFKNRNRVKNDKVKHFLDSPDNDDSDGLSDFPPKMESISGSKYTDYTPSFESGNEHNNVINDKYNNEQHHTQSQPQSDNGISVEAFHNLKNSEEFEKFIPYYNQMSDHGNKNEIFIDKLNYMIHLLEEQQEEKTGHITEELILYCFLGVFMIFMVDSFARVGKYVR